MSEHSAKAQRFLVSLRDVSTNSEDRFFDWIWLLHEIKEGSLSLADISTNEKEFEELRVNVCRDSARYRLESLRLDHMNYDMESLNERLERGGLNLADIGTSKEELEELRIKGCKARAQNLLSSIRRCCSIGHVNPLIFEQNYRGMLNDIRRNIKEGSLSLADIGTSEEEIGELWIRGLAKCG